VTDCPALSGAWHHVAGRALGREAHEEIADDAVLPHAGDVVRIERGRLAHVADAQNILRQCRCDQAAREGDGYARAERGALHSSEDHWFSLPAVAEACGCPPGWPAVRRLAPLVAVIIAPAREAKTRGNPSPCAAMGCVVS